MVFYTQIKRTYIAFGSNLGNPTKQINNALAAIKQAHEIRVNACSWLYQSEPLGPLNQPHYINAVAEIDTSLSAMQLLETLQKIEIAQGRVRSSERFAARTIDLDIIWYNNEIINMPNLIIPHYACKTREFVLYPLAELNPKLTFPDGESLSYLLTQVDATRLKRLFSALL